MDSLTRSPPIQPSVDIKSNIRTGSWFNHYCSIITHYFSAWYTKRSNVLANYRPAILLKFLAKQGVSMLHTSSRHRKHIFMV